MRAIFIYEESAVNCIYGTVSEKIALRIKL